MSCGDNRRKEPFEAALEIKGEAVGEYEQDKAERNIRMEMAVTGRPGAGLGAGRFAARLYGGLDIGTLAAPEPG